MSEREIDVPCYMPVRVVCGKKEMKIIAVPSSGCNKCVLRDYKLCIGMCCCADERADGQSVQFMKLEEMTQCSPIVFNTSAVIGPMRVKEGE